MSGARAGASKPTLLFLSQRLPYPPNKGEKIRYFQLLKYLARSFTIDLGCLIDDPADAVHIDAIRPWCRDIHVGRVNRRVGRLMCLTGLLTGEALSVTYFRDRGLVRFVRDVIDRVRPDVVFVNSSNMAPYVLDLPRPRLRLADLVDVDSEKWRAYADAASPPMRWLYRREAARIAALESRITRECDLSILVSEQEADVLRRANPDRADRIRGISNGVDHGYFDPSGAYPVPDRADGPEFLFTGTMDYPPNVDAVLWFAAEVLPLIRRRHPRARFTIVGHHPAPAVRHLADQPGITVTGSVADVRPYFVRADVAVAPMRIARGIQNKVLEAMAMAKPVIVTSGALEGIEAVPEREVLLADTAEAFAAAASRAADPTVGATLGKAARHCIVTRYDWEARLRQLDDVLHPASIRARPRPA